jgi:hypothetical protein
LGSRYVGPTALTWKALILLVAFSLFVILLLNLVLLSRWILRPLQNLSVLIEALGQQKQTFSSTFTHIREFSEVEHQLSAKAQTIETIVQAGYEFFEQGTTHEPQFFLQTGENSLGDLVQRFLHFSLLSPSILKKLFIGG